MGLLIKLQTQGSDLTTLDGKTPASYSGVSNYPQDLAKSQLDLDGLTPVSYNQQSNYTAGLAKSQLDLDGNKPTIPGKYPYLDNLPR